MFGEYIQSNQGTTRDIYGNVRSSAVDGRSPYVTSNYGTVDTLQLRDGRQVRVSAVDGDSPYIVARSNPAPFVEHQQIRDQYLSQLKLELETTDLTPNQKARIVSVYINEGKEARALIRKINADLKSQRSKSTNLVLGSAAHMVIIGASTYMLGKRNA